VYCSALQFVAVCVAVCCSGDRRPYSQGQTCYRSVLQLVAEHFSVFCRVLQGVAVCCSVLQRVAVEMTHRADKATCYRTRAPSPCVAACCSVLQRVAAKITHRADRSRRAIVRGRLCRVLLRVAACCSMLQRVAACHSGDNTSWRQVQTCYHKRAPWSRSLARSETSSRRTMHHILSTSHSSCCVHRRGCDCNTPQRTATHCNTLQHIATRRNTLQHTATHCNTLQHTATHCNSLQHSA